MHLAIGMWGKRGNTAQVIHSEAHVLIIFSLPKFFMMEGNI